MGMEMQYFIGQRIPLEYDWNIQSGPPLEAVWYIFQTKPQKEHKVKAWLEFKDIETWFPTETAYRRIPRGKVQKVAYDRKVIPRYVFARFTAQPNWVKILNGPLGRMYLSGVTGLNGKLLRVTDGELAEMQMLPSRLRKEREEIERAELEDQRVREQAIMLNPGDKVEVLDGPMQGWIVDVLDIKGRMATMVIPLLGERRVKIERERLRNVGEV